MNAHSSTKSNNTSSQGQEELSKRLKLLIDNLNTNFSAEALRETQNLFIEVSKVEKNKNEYLLREVRHLNSILDSISEESSNSNKQTVKSENRRILDTLKEILKTTA